MTATPSAATDLLRHVPAGRGHAYRPSLDQRVPVLPVPDESVQVRALVPEAGRDPQLEVVAGGRPQPAVTMTALAPADDTGDAGGDEGHLATAAAAGEHVTGMRPVAATIGPFDADTLVRYRIVADDAVSEWFEVHVAAWRPCPPDAVSWEGPVHQRVIDGSTEALVAGGATHRLRFALRLADDEHVLGLGERFHALDHRGRRIDTQVFEQYKQQGERTYLPAPFALVVGPAGSWGVHVATTRRCWWDVGATTHDRLVVEVDVAAGSPSVQVESWAGTPVEVLDGFTASVGRPAPVPSWVFRPWASGNEWNTQARVEAEMARSRAEGVDVGVLVIEAWADEATFTIWRDAQYEPRPDGGPMSLADFSFPPDGAWPDPVGMVRRLQQQGTKVLLWQIPVLPVDVPDERLGAEQLAHDRRTLVDRDLTVREEDGTPYTNRGWWFPGALLPDFTSPEARRWWTDKRRYLLEEVGVDGFKTDGGEHAWGDELRYADGTRGAETNNRYPNLYAETYHELLTDTGTDGVTFSRAGWTGAGTVPCHWAGDEDSTWDAYRASILAGLSAGMAGVSAWGWDHGGFSGEIPDPELYLRSAAMAMLCPIMQYHSEFNHHREPCRDRTPWNIAERHDAPEVLDLYRRYTRIRGRLVDYLDEQYHDGARRGLPLMRALALHWPDHGEVWEHPFQYLLGDHLLVAPVTEPGRTSIPVWLPPGDWLDAWTGDRFHGARTLHVATPIDRIPAFVSADQAGAEVREAFTEK